MKATPRSYTLATIQALLWIVGLPLIVILLLGCSPRAFDSVNKQAPDPPYAGQRHSGLDRAEYLRDTEPLEAR